MAFTTISRIKGGKDGLFDGDWMNEGQPEKWNLHAPYFYPEDVDNIRNQGGIAALQICPALFGSKDAVDRYSLVLIGLRFDEPNKRFVRVDHPDGIIALFCGHFNNTGGNFEDKPIIDLTKLPVTVVEGP